MADFSMFTTPDGRQVQLPESFASQFVGLTPAAPPAPSGGPLLAMPPVLPPPDDGTPSGAAPAPAPSPVPLGPPPGPPDSVPVTSPDQLPPPTGQPGLSPRGPVTSPAEDAGTSARVQPQGAPPGQVTNNQLAAMGNAGVYNAQQQGLVEERAATARQGEALANQATAVGNAMVNANAEADRLLAQRQRVAEDNARALQAKQDEYLRNAKAIADTRIDRTIDHPVMTAIGLALSSFGSAMKGQSNEGAIKGIYEAIDRKVAGQMQDLDQRRQGLGIQREAIGMQAQAGKDRLEQLDTYRIAAIEQAKRRIEQVKQSTTSDIVRANSEMALAGLTQKQGEILGGAVGREQQKREAEAARAQTAQLHRESLAVTIRGQNFEQGRFEAQLAETRQEKAAALAEKLIDAKGAAGAAQAKLLGEQGIVDPGTGDFMLTPAGQQKMAQADNVEAQARKATDPQQAQKLNTYAQQLRQSAQLNDVATAVSKKGAEDAQKTAKVAQDMSNNVDAARQMLTAGPEAWNREDWAQLRVALQGVKVNYAQQMGERMSPKALDAIDDVLSIDPDSIWSRETDKGKAIAALDTIEKQINQSADVALKSAGVKSGWTPAKRERGADFSGRTAQEIAEGAKPGWSDNWISNPLKADLDAIQNPGNASWSRWNKIKSGEQQQEDAFNEASRRTGKLADGSPGRPSDYGLAPQTESNVDSLVKRTGTAGHAEYDRILNDLATPLLLISGEKARPSLARGVAEKLRNENPQLLNDVLESIASKPGGGQQKADEIRKAVEIPKLTPASNGGLTPDAAAELAAQKDRVRRGLPPNDDPPPQMRDAGPAPPIPPFIRPEDRPAWLDYMRRNGFAGAFGAGALGGDGRGGAK